MHQVPLATSQTNSHFISLAVNGDKLYRLKNGSRSVEVCNKFNGTKVQLIHPLGLIKFTVTNIFTSRSSINQLKGQINASLLKVSV